MTPAEAAKALAVHTQAQRELGALEALERVWAHFHDLNPEPHLLIGQQIIDSRFRQQLALALQLGVEIGSAPPWLGELKQWLDATRRDVEAKLRQEGIEPEEAPKR